MQEGGFKTQEKAWVSPVKTLTRAGTKGIIHTQETIISQRRAATEARQATEVRTLLTE